MAFIREGITDAHAGGPPIAFFKALPVTSEVGVKYLKLQPRDRWPSEKPTKSMSTVGASMIPNIMAPYS